MVERSFITAVLLEQSGHTSVKGNRPKTAWREQAPVTCPRVAEQTTKDVVQAEDVSKSRSSNTSQTELNFEP